MLIRILEHPLFWVVVFSFLAGMIGYIIVTVWIRPVARYRRAKGRIRKNLTEYERWLDQAEEIDSGTQEQSHQAAVTLSELYQNGLPAWYRILLANQGESPQQAVAVLMKLAKTRNPTHARKQIAEIQQALDLGLPAGKYRDPD